MTLRKVLAACAALALTGVDAGHCRVHSSHSIASSSVTESSTVVSASTATESSVASSSSVAESSTTISSTAISQELSSSTAESSATTTSAAATTTRYLSNPGFDNGGAGWSRTGGGSINDQNRYRTAPGSAQLYVEQTGQGAASTISTSLKNLVPGQDYEVSLYWLLTWYGSNDACSFVFYVGDEVYSNLMPLLGGDVWRPLTQPFTATSPDPVLNFQLWCSSIPSNGESDWSPLVNVYVDDAAVVEAAA